MRQILNRCGTVGYKVLSAIGLVFLIACDQKTVEMPVAQVGDVHISAEELRRFALDVLPGLRPAKQGQEARRDYLQTLIDRQLILLEAAELGLGQEPDVRAKALRQRREYLANLYRRREIYPKAQVSEADLQRYFTEEGLGRERLLSAILVATEAEAKALLEQLQAGASFEGLAASHTLDERVAERGGELGFMNRSMAQGIGVPMEIFDNQEKGAISQPLPIGDRYHLVRFIDERQVSFDQKRDALAKYLAKARKLEVEAQTVELLAYEMDWQLAPAGLALLQAQAQALETDGLKLGETPLFTFEKGQVAVDEYLETLKVHQIRNRAALEDSAFIKTFVRRRVLPELALARAAEQAGVLDEPEVAQWLEGADEELLIKAVYQRKIEREVEVGDEEALAYIAANPQKFMSPEFICFDELIAPDQEVGQALLDSLGGVEDWVALAKARGYKVRPRREDGLVCMHSYNSSPYPELWRALQGAVVGAIGGPVQTREGYALFKVVHKEAPQPEPSERALLRARSTLLGKAQQAHFDQWVQTLREKYRDKVKIDNAQLEAALPEALLASLVRET